MNMLYRFASDGKYLGQIVIDRPLDQYSHRTDLTAKQPPLVFGEDYWPYYSSLNGGWILKSETQIPPAPRPA